VALGRPKELVDSARLVGKEDGAVTISTRGKITKRQKRIRLADSCEGGYHNREVLRSIGSNGSTKRMPEKHSLEDCQCHW